MTDIVGKDSVLNAEPGVPAAPSVDELIARLEEVEGGSRQLDWAIHGAPPPPPPAYDWSNVPAYTTSLDAALTLVPEGAVWHVMTDYGGLNRAKIGPAGRPSASVYHPRKRDEIFIQADAETPALALCIAALKARRTVPPTVACEATRAVEHRCRARTYTRVNMTDTEQALSEIKRRAVRTDLRLYDGNGRNQQCICITEDALREALKEVFGDDSVLDPEPSKHTR